MFTENVRYSFGEDSGGEKSVLFSSTFWSSVSKTKRMEKFDGKLLEKYRSDVGPLFYPDQ